ncbi:serine/threonine-protein phosphatase 2A 55 kDa regulatory subunit B delta isoform isoform X3 [Monodelphis domestica]|uniref:serine/threonine-protein phosphatase 2A 55 kDa regulatory subunit B delta isoform isoform X3 n=1 Tax=Monodelphis domestica TaxID=13616 RepID=UPI0024E247E4|nr:serine/threonine-protein phosphatase 2A 55 kDa regulatory subunit B delta isoform isoform X3 [Monodelphis domestica]
MFGFFGVVVQEFLNDLSAICLPADIISTVEFNHSGDLLATGDKGGRVVIFQKEHENKSRPHSRGEYNVYSTFQSHEPEFDYLKSLEIEEKINKIRWLPQQNAAHFLLSTNDKTIKLWKISERDKRAEGYNLKDEDGRLRNPFRITALRVPILKPTELMVEASPRRVFANAHTYHINSISVNSDHETYLSADDLRINLWHLEITNRSFNIVDIKPVNMEELTEVITAAEFHPHQCNVFVYSSSKGTIRLCDMRSSALCDRHSKFFEEPEDPSSRSFFSEIISSISDVKFSHGGRYMMTRDYLSVKVWDLNMESRPVETYQRPHDRLLQQLLPDVRQERPQGRHSGGVPGEQQAPRRLKASQGVSGGQEEEGRDQRGQPGLQQEDPAHGLAPPGQRHRGGGHQQPVHLPGQDQLRRSAPASGPAALVGLREEPHRPPLARDAGLADGARRRPPAGPSLPDYRPRAQRRQGGRPSPPSPGGPLGAVFKPRKPALARPAAAPTPRAEPLNKSEKL